MKRQTAAAQTSILMLCIAACVVLTSAVATGDANQPGLGCEPSECDDGNACTVETCDGPVCVHTPVVCNDANDCTDDTCVPPSGCVYTPDDANACSDANPCTTLDVCRAGSCVCGALGVCGGTTLVRQNTTPVAIPPEALPTVSSTIVVSGAGLHLLDVDVTTFVRHEHAEQLDITLQSPAGTIVTLTTDNGWYFDNTFNGTIWDDDANPGGAVPYELNNGLATDHWYSDQALASPLAPEEALAAFIGENANGTWRLTISDDAYQFGGSLDRWSLALKTRPTAPTMTTSSYENATPVPIPAGPAVVGSSIVVPVLTGPVGKVRVTTDLRHGAAADLDVTLRSPAGTVVTLTTDNGATHDNVFNGTVWDDDANPDGQVPYPSNNGTSNDGMASDHFYYDDVPVEALTPEEPFGAFIGENAAGTWTLTISDDLADNEGMLDRWVLEITTAGCDPYCALDCDDDNPCTVDTCDPATGCVHSLVVCNDGNPCTNDTCDPATGCLYTPDDRHACSDGNSCTTPDACRSGQCACGEFVACPVPSSVTRRNTNVIPIPDDFGPTVSSNIVVAGAGTYLTDAQVQTFVTHTYVHDLAITLKSPAGTIVTLTTQNGGGLDNTFNGTLWDDHANPAGQVPYDKNDGLVDDHFYLNNVLASPIAPEEAFAAFRGENPNGTWTLTINDAAWLDEGTLWEWSLIVSTIPGASPAAPVSESNTTPLPLPDLGTTSSTISMSSLAERIAKVRVTTFLRHTNNDDMDITIQSPSGTVVTLTTDNGSANDNVYDGTVWDDDADPLGQVPAVTNDGLVCDHRYANDLLASPLAPEEALGAFADEDPNGIWTLTLSDDTAGNTGVLDRWSLEVTTYECPGTCAPACDDGVSCTVDSCSPTGACVNTGVPPVPVSSPAISWQGKTTMSWPASPGATHWNVSRGSIPALGLSSRPPASRYDHTCFESADSQGNGPGLSVDAANPVRGTAFYYLVSAENSCAESSLGNASSGAPRPNPLPCPTPP